MRLGHLDLGADAAFRRARRELVQERPKDHQAVVHLQCGFWQTAAPSGELLPHE